MQAQAITLVLWLGFLGRPRTVQSLAVMLRVRLKATLLSEGWWEETVGISAIRRAGLRCVVMGLVIYETAIQRVRFREYGRAVVWSGSMRRAQSPAAGRTALLLGSMILVGLEG